MAGAGKEPSELGVLWEVHVPPRASWLQVLVARCPGLCPPTMVDSLCCSLREALVQCGKEHQKDRTIPKYYVSYLLAMLNNNLALR